MKQVLLLAAALLLPGCGKFIEKYQRSSSTTEVRFDKSTPGIGTFLASNLYGKVAVFATRSDGVSYSTNLYLSNKLDTGSMSLPNGQYKFYAVGWDGEDSGACANPSPCEPLRNTTYCSDVNGVSAALNGGTSVVAFTMTSTNCDINSGTFFSQGHSVISGGFKATLVELCHDNLGACGAPSGSGIRDVGAYLLRTVKTGATVSVLSETQVKCAQTDNSGMITFYQRFVPGNSSIAGSDIFPVRFKVFSSEDSTCSGTTLSTFSFLYGLDWASSSPGGTVSYSYSNSMNSSSSLLKLLGPF